MILFQIDDIKDFMTKLFKDKIFDDFEVLKIDINQGVSFHIDGLLDHDYYNSLEQELITNQSFIRWKDLKDIVFSIIKGNKSPSYMKIILSLSENNRDNLLSKINNVNIPKESYGFLINIVFTLNVLKIITGTNYKSFTMDKEAEKYFDESVEKFLVKHNISFVSTPD